MRIGLNVKRKRNREPKLQISLSPVCRILLDERDRLRTALESRVKLTDGW
jgi:hypothetical protein